MNHKSIIVIHYPNGQKILDITTGPMTNAKLRAYERLCNVDSADWVRNNKLGIEFLKQNGYL